MSLLDRQDAAQRERRERKQRLWGPTPSPAATLLRFPERPTPSPAVGVPITGEVPAETGVAVAPVTGGENAEPASSLAAVARPSIEAILRAACRYFHIRKEMLLSERRHGDLVRARHIASYLAYEETVLTFPAIGRHLKRDHTSIVHGYYKIRALRDEDAELDQHVRNVLGLAHALQRGDAANVKREAADV